MSDLTFDTFRCPHGYGPTYRGFTGLMAAPYATCRCCGTTYYYIDSAMYGSRGSKGRTHTPNLCDQCGGKYEEWATGEEVEANHE